MCHNLDALNSDTVTVVRRRQEEDAAVERSHKEIEMLDGISKNVVVLVTQDYVTEATDLRARTAFKKRMIVAKEKGWYETGLLDASGKPYNNESAATQALEKKVIKQLLSGKAYHDEVTRQEGERYLRAAPAAPVVMKKCVLRHENDKDMPKGKSIGALRYIIPID